MADDRHVLDVTYQGQTVQLLPKPDGIYALRCPICAEQAAIPEESIEINLELGRKPSFMGVHDHCGYALAAVDGELKASPAPVQAPNPPQASE